MVCCSAWSGPMCRATNGAWGSRSRSADLLVTEAPVGGGTSLPSVVADHSRDAGLSADGQLVGRMRCVVALGTLAGQLGEGSLDLAPDAADRDAEHPLATLEQVDDLVGRS